MFDNTKTKELKKLKLNGFEKRQKGKVEISYLHNVEFNRYEWSFIGALG